MAAGTLFSLEGRTALVTGASRGIGRAIAEGLAAYGAAVVCAARTGPDLEVVTAQITRNGGRSHALRLDLNDRAGFPSAVAEAEAALGPIDILVNNAGVNFREPAAAASPAHFDQIVSVNLSGLFFLTREVARGMAARRAGKIINIGSITTGFGLAQLSVYGATKAAVGGFTQSLAVELGRCNVQVNAICPGFVRTDLTRKLWSLPAMRDWGERRIPLGRTALPDDLVGAAVFLASRASDYVTGHLLYVDGGFTAGEAWPIPDHGGNAAPPGQVTREPSV
jgi:gluconate 5-dehydrogenase